jgi:hypothetical protein
MRMGRFISIQDIKNTLSTIYNTTNYPLDELAKLLGQNSANVARSEFTFTNQDIPYSNLTKLVWTTAVLDNMGMIASLPSGDLTVASDCIIDFICRICWQDDTTGTRRLVESGDEFGEIAQERNLYGSPYLSMQISGSIKCAAAATLRMWAFHTATGMGERILTGNLILMRRTLL